MTHDQPHILLIPNVHDAARCQPIFSQDIEKQLDRRNRKRSCGFGNPSTGKPTQFGVGDGPDLDRINIRPLERHRSRTDLHLLPVCRDPMATIASCHLNRDPYLLPRRGIAQATQRFNWAPGTRPGRKEGCQSSASRQVGVGIKGDVNAFGPSRINHGEKLRSSASVLREIESRVS